MDRLLQRVSPQLRLYVYEMTAQPITGQPLLRPNLAKNLAFEELGRGHPDLALMPASDDIKARRFEQGARCLGVYRKGKLIGFMWFGRGRYEEDEVRCTYCLADPDCSVFDFDVYVFPEHRMGVGFMGVWHGASLFLGGQGVRHTFSRMTRFNLASRRAHAHLGSKRAGYAVFLKMWKVEFMISTLAPFVALTAGSRRVDLRLPPGRRVLAPAAPAPSDDDAVCSRGT